jgi:hypothetical protein
MRLTSGALVDLVRQSSSGPGGADPTREELVRAARYGRLLPTLVSAWLADGERVPPSLVDELDAGRAREGRYRHVAELLRAEIGAGLRVRKGWEIAHLLPAGWFRASRDLDIEVPEVGQLCTGAAALVEQGWTVDRLSAFQDNGTLHLAADLADRRHGAHPDDHDLVQLQTCVHLGPAWSAPPVGHCPLIAAMAAPSRSLVDLLAAAAQRRPTARDVLDRMTLWTVDADGLELAVVRLELVPEWRRLGSLVARHWPGIGAGRELAAASEQRALATVRRRRHRLHRAGAATAADAFRAGRVVSGAPTCGRSPGPLSVRVRGDDVVFEGPLGGGGLTVPAVRHTEGLGWLHD